MDLLALEGPGAGRQASNVISAYRSWNRELVPIVSVADGDERSAWSISNGRVSRLDLDVNCPRTDLLARLSSLRSHDRSEPRLKSQIRRAFGRDDVSAAFLENLRRGVSLIADHVSAELGIERDQASRFALRLCSRLLFLQFIQVEGWLDHDRSFLRNRVSEAVRKDQSAYRTVLHRLFFGALDRPAAKRSPSARKLGAIPFLNGGLFRRIPLERTHPSLDLPNSLTKYLIEEVFEPFTYTVREDDDEGMSIDPEMLGQVFESLMSSEERAGSGSFYTPRRVVDRLSRHAIMQWLAGEESDEAARFDITAQTPERRRRYLRRLQRIRVVDPACGSGAFLLSSMHALEALRIQLGESLAGSGAAGLRRKIVVDSLHGVDLKPEAVELCELRLWLAIAGAERSLPTDRIRPLPNLDRNIRQGNALLSPCDLAGRENLALTSRLRRDGKRRLAALERYREGGEGTQRIARRLKGFDRSTTLFILRQLIALDRAEISLVQSQTALLDRRASPALEALKERLRERIRTLRRAERGELDAFSWDVHFDDVTRGRGFDLVIGNPPWVRSSRVSSEIRARLAERYESARGHSGARQFDLATIFVESALERVAADGIVSMLVPSKILKANFGRPIRERIENRHSLISIHDWSHDSSLFDADTFPVALTIAKDPARAGAVSIIESERSFEISKDRMRVRGRWLTLPPRLLELIDSISKRHRTLGEVLRRNPLMGARTGANAESFIAIDNQDAQDLNEEDVALFARGRDVRRWRYEPSTLLRCAEHRLPGFVSPAHTGFKVAWKDVAVRLECVVLPPRRRFRGQSLRLIPNQTLYCLEASGRDEAMFLSALLNSTVCTFLAIALADQAKDGHFRFYGDTVGRIPFPSLDVDSVLRRRLVRLALEAHRGRADASLVDETVMTAYGLNSSERATILEFMDGRFETVPG